MADIRLQCKGALDKHLRKQAERLGIKMTAYVNHLVIQDFERAMANEYQASISTVKPSYQVSGSNALED